MLAFAGESPHETARRFDRRLLAWPFRLTAFAQRPNTTTLRSSPTLSSGEIQATPEMWFYDQERRRYEDPKTAVRANAEFRAASGTSGWPPSSGMAFLMRDQLPAPTHSTAIIRRAGSETGTRPDGSAAAATPASCSLSRASAARDFDHSKISPRV